MVNSSYLNRVKKILFLILNHLIFIRLEMKRTLSFFLKYFLFWFSYFILFKILFLLSNFGNTVALGWYDFFGVFIHGSKMDFSAAGYFTLFPGMILVFTSFLSHRLIGQIIKGYTLFLLIMVTLLGLFDIALYPEWGSRLNAQILPYLANPAGMIASVTGWQLLLFIVLETGIVYLIFWVYRKMFNKKYFEGKRLKWSVSPVILLLTVALIIPIRGGFGTSPLNFSSVYFSQNLYANHGAYNFFWSFNHAVLHNKVKTNPVHYFSEDECKIKLAGIEKLNQEKLPVLIKNKSGKPVNVIIVILESFSNKVVEPLGGLPGITPRFNQFCKEGILFSSFYATGNRSDKGLSSIIASYPALIKASSILYFPEKMKKLDFFPNHFRQKGYHLSFFYGGDVNFYNTRMLMMQSGVEEIISRNDYTLHLSSIQKWGVPDQYLYQRMFDDLQKMQQPFLSLAYTISSHEPFDIPKFKRFPGNSFTDQYCNSIAYADSCLGSFIDQLKSSTLWDNTLVVITSDHASLEPGPTTFDNPASYRIPLLWLGGVLDSVLVVNNIAMQTDLGSTIIQQMGWSPTSSFFSKNIFGTKQYAFYLRDEGWGFVSPEAGFFMNLESKKQQFFYGENSQERDSLTSFSKSFVQFLHDDFLKK
jgi:phosphoglycerol transferase MdoB-like AlkP superfamily enzyme